MKVYIQFIHDGACVSHEYVDHVPRVGDEVSLPGYQYLLQVFRVVWTYEPINYGHAEVFVTRD